MSINNKVLQLPSNIIRNPLFLCLEYIWCFHFVKKVKHLSHVLPRHQGKGRPSLRVFPCYQGIGKLSSHVLPFSSSSSSSARSSINTVPVLLECLWLHHWRVWKDGITPKCFLLYSLLQNWHRSLSISGKS